MVCVILFIANGSTPVLFRFCLDNSTVAQVLPVRYSFLSFVTHHCNTYNIGGYCGFLYLDKNGQPMVAMHWEHFFKHIWQKYNSIYREQLPLITPHVCRHTYCSNMAKSGMNPKTLQYLMGHSDIGITLNTYTHLGYEDAKDELQRLVKAG